MPPNVGFRARRASRLGSPQQVAPKAAVSFEDPAPAGFVGLAVITSPIGLQGQVRAKPLASANRIYRNTPALSSASLLSRLRQVWLQSATGWRLTKILACSPRGRDFCLEFACSRNRLDAESLIGTRLGTLRNNEILTDKASFGDDVQPVFWADLIGREVHNVAGERLGQIDRLETNGVHDWIVVAGVFIPLVDRHVHAMGSSSTPMVVDWEKDWA